MADETWINTGGTFQQPYQGQTPANAQNPEPRQTTYTVPANAQSPFTYSSRTPTTYRNPVNQQEPNIRNVQSPFTYNRQGSQPTTYQHRSPFTYQSSESAQSPFTYNHRSPTTYNHRSPSTYQFRTPSTYNFRSPSVYRTPVNAQEPNIRDRQTAYPYIANAQEPNTRDAQQPYPYIAAGQEPNIRNRQNAYPYIAAGQEPNIRNNQAPFTYNHRSPTTYSFRSPETYQHRSPFTYNHRTPSEYSHRSPFTYNFQNPTVGTKQGRVPYATQGRTPFIYDTTTYRTETEANMGASSTNGESAYANGIIEAYTWYATGGTGDIEVWVKASGVATDTVTFDERDPMVWTKCFRIYGSLTTAASSPYTVKYSITNGDPYDSSGLDPESNMTLTTTAQNVPAATSTLFFKYKAEAEADPGSDEMMTSTFDVNFIFEHATLQNFTYTLQVIAAKAEASADEE